MVRQLSFSLHFRNTAEHQAALEDAIDVCFPEGSDAQDVREASSTQVLGSSTLKADRMKMDALGMFIERRIIAESCHDESIISGHLFSDGSPVTGAEIQ